MLDFEMEESEDELLVRYEFVNETGYDIFLVNALFRLENGGPRVDRRMVYTEISGNHLTLTKQALPAPIGTRLKNPTMPYATTVGQGGRVAESLTVTLPICYHNPHSLVLQTETVKCAVMHLRLGFVPQDAISPRPRGFQRDGVILYRLAYHAALAAQRFVESDARAVSLMVLKEP